MKVRNGFVSNSSSSSFIVYGAEVEFNEKIQEDASLNEKYAVHYGEDYLYIGKTLMYGVEEESVKQLELPNEKFITELKQDISDAYNKNNVEVTNSRFGLFAGNIPN